MRKGLTLIELILTMVIIAVVFTVIPKLILSMNQGAQTTIKEEAAYNALALMGAIVNLPWDANNTDQEQILHTTSGSAVYECNATNPNPFYRIGGFIGSRHCRPTDTDLNLTASLTLGRESDGLYNDIDDYDQVINADNNCSRNALGGPKSLYTLTPSIRYVNDPMVAGSALALSDTNFSLGQSSNTKRIMVNVGYHIDNKHSGCISAFEYQSFNIGHIQINSRSW